MQSIEFDIALSKNWNYLLEAQLTFPATPTLPKEVIIFPRTEEQVTPFMKLLSENAEYITNIRRNCLEAEEMQTTRPVPDQVTRERFARSLVFARLAARAIVIDSPFSTLDAMKIRRKSDNIIYSFLTIMTTGEEGSAEYFETQNNVRAYKEDIFKRVDAATSKANKANSSSGKGVQERIPVMQ